MRNRVVTRSITSDEEGILKLGLRSLLFHQKSSIQSNRSETTMRTSFAGARQNLSTRFRLSIFVAAFIVALLLTFAAGAERNQRDEKPPYRNPNLQVDQRVVDLLSRMTLEEKIAQTESLW